MKCHKQMIVFYKPMTIKCQPLFFILKFSTCCCNTNLDDYFLNMSCYLSFKCFKVTLCRITVHLSRVQNRPTHYPPFFQECRTSVPYLTVLRHNVEGQFDQGRIVTLPSLLNREYLVGVLLWPLPCLIKIIRVKQFQGVSFQAILQYSHHLSPSVKIRVKQFQGLSCQVILQPPSFSLSENQG